VKFILEEQKEYDFNLIGISCHDNRAYRICWAINNALGLSLQKEPCDIVIKDSKHPFFYYKEEATQNEFYLICNRTLTGLLVPEQKHADYLMMIKENYFINFDNLRSKLNSINFILTSFLIDVDNLKSKDKLCGI